MYVYNRLNVVFFICVRNVCGVWYVSGLCFVYCVWFFICVWCVLCDCGFVVCVSVRVWYVFVFVICLCGLVVMGWVVCCVNGIVFGVHSCVGVVYF